MDNPTKKESGEQLPQVSGYCVKCKEKRVMIETRHLHMSADSGDTRPAMAGACSVCGAGMFKMLQNDNGMHPVSEHAQSGEQKKSGFVYSRTWIWILVIGFAVLGAIFNAIFPSSKDVCQADVEFYFKSKTNSLCEDFHMDRGCKLPSEPRKKLDLEKENQLAGCR